MLNDKCMLFLHPGSCERVPNDWDYQKGLYRSQYLKDGKCGKCEINPFKCACFILLL